MVAIRVVVATDNRLYQEALALCLSSDADLHLSGAVSDPVDLLTELHRLAVDLVLLDMSMPDSLETLRKLSSAAPRTPVLGLAVPEIEQIVIPMIQAGLSGYLPREGSVADLILLIRSVVRGETIASPHIVASLFGELRNRPSVTNGYVEPLTRREWEITRLLELGCSNKHIAIKLGIRLPTVKKHVHRVLQKLHVENRGQVGEVLRRRRLDDWHGGITGDHVRVQRESTPSRRLAGEVPPHQL